MSRRDPLVPLVDGEPAPGYWARVGKAIMPGRDVVIRTSRAFGLNTGYSGVGASLWTDVGIGRESWQKVSATLFADTYDDAIMPFAALLEARRLASQS